ncbi:MAG: hypothetical protein GKS06_12455 [Acidobacteria bacterium]|nr:hypothetical protein [Acidobacteriota bacterium]
MNRPADRFPAALRFVAIAGIVALLGLIAWSWWSGGLVGVLLDSSIDNAAKLEHVRNVFARFGALAPVAYVAAVTIEVVIAPLPGLALYAPGGLIFGGFWGGLLSLIGNVIGAAIAFGIARVLGRARAQRYLESGELARIEQKLTARGGWVVFLLRINPLTSSDLVSYAAGLTSMRLRTLLIGSAIGLAPLNFIQSYAAAGLVEAFPWLIEPLLALAVIYVIAAIWLLRRLGRPAP